MKKSYLRSLFSLRTLAIFLIYFGILLIAAHISVMLRFDFNFKDIYKNEWLKSVYFVLIPIQLVSLVVFGRLRELLAFFHMPDLLRVFWAMTVASVLFLCLSFAGMVISRGVVVMDYICAIVMICGFRLSLRVWRERLMRDSVHAFKQKRVAIIGAGNLGFSLASDMLSKPNMGLKPVAFLDESPEKIGRQILGLNIFDLNTDFRAFVMNMKIDRAVIAISNLPNKHISDITSKFSKLGIEVSIVPSYYELAAGISKVSNIHEVSIEDVLNRPQIALNSEAVDNMIKGKIIMVTGAGGSIGSELCMQIAAKSPSLLLLLDHCEVQLFKIEQKVLNAGYGVSIKSLVGSVADEHRMEHIISMYKPQLIFHAAAHKHVPMMEAQPGEALKNNTLGTWRVAQLASKYGAEKFLLISTDKAINPTNVMGATKRLAEKVVQSMQNKPDNKTQFVAVRFGNVLGSSGSVILTFKRQIAEGGPVTVTHPEVTRYFMTIPEAVGLVLQCGAQAIGGEIFVLDMGEPVKIVDLARHMIRLSGFEPDVDIKIKFIGLRPGEKLYEELQHKNESLVKTPHERIFGFVSEPPSFDEMRDFVSKIETIADTSSNNDLKKYILSNVKEYNVQFYD